MKEEVIPEDERDVLFSVDWDKVQTVDDIKEFLRRRWEFNSIKGTLKDMRTSPMRKFVKGFEDDENSK